MEICENRTDHLAAFLRLNERWISQYFRIEEADRRLAGDPECIIREGGFVFTVVDGHAVVGACALVREDETAFELVRMAVDPGHQRRGIGRRLAEHALARAHAEGALRVRLLSNTSLSAAIALYRSLGFRSVREGPHPVYRRCNIVMEKVLRSPGGRFPPDGG